AGLGALLGDDPQTTDAARRAGLLALPLAADGTPQLADIAAPFIAAADSLSAIAAVLDGARFLAGDFETMALTADFLALAAADEPWRPQPAVDGWQLSRAGEVLAALGPAGGPIDLPVAPGQSIHWFDPLQGLLLGLATPEPDPQHAIMAPAGAPLAVVVAPSRYQPDRTDAFDD
ncbi:MAG TPA: hypothetical protein DCZ72_04165, partial [Armatimonadetes bacterium]|nr:hypothetical protein [Armatimonadota bacterium]